MLTLLAGAVFAGEDTPIADMPPTTHESEMGQQNSLFDALKSIDEQNTAKLGEAEFVIQTFQKLAETTRFFHLDSFEFKKVLTSDTLDDQAIEELKTKYDLE